ncbi:hypothetical protein FRB99_008698 [Tulasnella sp. 403]|nr:hypothetical protein FRB99_008698 [Tulasnella sp. 403]
MDTDGDDLTVDSGTILQDIQSERRTWAESSTSLYNRNSSQLMDAMEMEWGTDIVASVQLLVLDTNVLVSQLQLLRSLVNHLLAIPSQITIVVPGIVIQELDGLRNSSKTNEARRADGSTVVVQVSSLARQANDWLLPLVNQSKVVRGQRMSECPRGNWMYNRDGLQNDDLIVECAAYFAQLYHHVKILSHDRNLGLKAGVEDIMKTTGFVCIGPPSSCTANQLLSKLQARQMEVLPSDPLYASRLEPQIPHIPQTSSSRNTTQPQRLSKKVSSMEVDHEPQPSIASHPLDVLHDQLRSYLIATLPGLVTEGIAQLRHRRESEEREFRQISIHARPARPPLVPLPDDDEWQTWSPKECILWLDKVLPPQKNLRANSALRLAEFIIPYGDRGGRRGRDWGRGDWDATTDCVERFCGEAVAGQLRLAVEQAFTKPTR